MTKDVPLFAAPEQERVWLSGAFEDLGAQRGNYTRYRPAKRVACDECIAYLHLHQGQGPAPRSSKFTRRSLGHTLRLCAAHADLWRAHDVTVVGL